MLGGSYACHHDWAHTLEPTWYNHWAHLPWSLCSASEATAVRSPCTATRSPPLTRILQSLHYPSTPFSSLHPLPPQFRALPTWMTSRCVVPTSIHPPLIQSPGGNQNCLLRRQNGPTSTLPTALQYLLTSPSSRSLKSLSSICLGQLYLANHQIQPSTRSEERRELNFRPVLEKSYSHHTPVGNN